MRLLHLQDDGSVACTEFGKHSIPQYAILSHTWGEGEVTLKDLLQGNPTNLNGYRKIRFCGMQAAKDGLKYFWVDTCCIDKQNLPELTRAINSMFRWYRNAARCYVYLSDVSVSNAEDVERTASSWLEAFRRSRWFTRGWTLQELLAPMSVDFFSAEGCLLGTKQSLGLRINEITRIPMEAIHGRSLDNFSALERLAWAEDRETSEEEDIAYCLLGIFDVFMPLIYGEGRSSALTRLAKLVDESINDASLGDLEEADHHSDDEPSLLTVSESRHASEPGLGSSDDEDRARKRRKHYLLGALGRHHGLIMGRLQRRRMLPAVLSPWHQALCLSSNVAQGASAGSIFQESHFSFLKAFFWDEWPYFEVFTNRSEMMTDILNYCKTAKNSSRLLLACKSIDYFALRWEAFFKVVEVAIDVDYEWASTVWGAIRLVFVRCFEFVNMFEKLAQMLDMMRQRLHTYHDHITRIRDRCPEALKRHLGKALAFVYADILQFCQDACMLFNKSSNEQEVEPSLLKALLSAPFDIRFQSLLHRLDEHKVLFDIELRANKHDSIKAFVQRALRDLVERDAFMQERGLRQNLEERKSVRERIFRQAIGNWAQSPDYRADFGALTLALGCRRNQHTLHGKLRCKGLNQSRVPITDPRVQLAPLSRGLKVLFLSPRTTTNFDLISTGPPGFGKTVLSTAIVEDLGSFTSTKPTSPYDSPRSEVVYFYFNAQVLGKQSYCNALRAMVTQLAEFLTNDAETIDSASLLMFCQDGSQSIATDDELMEFLLLSARRCSSVAIVLDGVDECQDFEKMWPFLSAACTSTRIKCVLLGRPSIAVPQDYAHLISRQSLIGANARDIWTYLYRETCNLQTSGLLRDHIIKNDIVDILTSRANSRFLWASLMMSYLKSPTLSPAEREGEIENSLQLESLHSMYSGMLRQFESLFHSERALLTKILQFLVLSNEPQSIDQLNIAISIKPGRRLSKEDQVPNMSDTLHRLCGPLVHIGPDLIVSLSHLSFRAFLLSEDAAYLRTPFRVDARAGSLRIAVVCLSYLVNDVPQAPLSSFPDTAADKSEVALQLPLSEYSARHWVDHAVSALRLMPGNAQELISDCYPLLRQLGPFLSRKTPISVWIEICWTFGCRPSVGTLWQELEVKLRQTDSAPQKNSISRRAIEFLGQIQALSGHLDQLDQHWKHLLSARPHEIWGASISAFLGPASWVHNDEVNVTVISNEESEEDINDTILKASKLSVCGKYLGIVRIFHRTQSRYVNTVHLCTCGRMVCVCDGKTSSVNLSDAVARYQVLEMRPGFPVVRHFPIDLNANDLREVEKTAEGHNFRFPIAFDPNLQCVSILRTLFWQESDGSLQQQRLDTPSFGKPEPDARRESWHWAEDRKRMIHWLPDSYPILTPWSYLDDQTRNAWAISKPLLQNFDLRSKFYKVKFSPCGQYVALAERQSEGDEIPEGWWTFHVWQKQSLDVSLSSNTLPWEQIAMLNDIYGDFLHDETFTFHPQFQIIVLKERAEFFGYQTSIWKFGLPITGKSKTTMVYATGLRGLHFSPCGTMLFGEHWNLGSFRTVSLQKHLADAIPIRVPVSDPMENVEVQAAPNTNDSETDPNSAHSSETTATQLIVATEARNTMNSSNRLTLAVRDGVPELSTVRSYADGAVVLKRLSPLTEDEKCLLYLPDHTDTSTSINILDKNEATPELI